MRSVREEINNVEAMKSIAMMRWSWMVVRLPAQRRCEGVGGEARFCRLKSITAA